VAHPQQVEQHHQARHRENGALALKSGKERHEDDQHTNGARRHDAGKCERRNYKLLRGLFRTSRRGGSTTVPQKRQERGGSYDQVAEHRRKKVRFFATVDLVYTLEQEKRP
jgi:hypothetical protein